MTTVHLIIFDLDGTLAPFDSSELYPDAKRWIEENPEVEFAIATNQGGIGLRHWMEIEGFGEPDKYPTLTAVKARLDKLFPLNDRRPAIYICARYQSKKSGKWCPIPDTDEGQHPMWREDWRKPATGMLEAAMTRALVYPQETLVVGDSDEDEQAATAAHCAFMWAVDFFKRAPSTDAKP